MLDTRKMVLMLAVIIVVMVTGVIVEQEHQIHTTDFPGYELKMQKEELNFLNQLPKVESETQSLSMQSAYALFKSEKYKKAYQALKPYALNGNAKALLVMGYLNEFGLGRPVDPKAAALWYYQAIHHNQFNDGSIAHGVKNYFGIQGDKVDYEKAARWFQMAAELSVDKY